MLPSKQRLSRKEFEGFLAQRGLNTVFNNLGTLKYKKGSKTAFSVVISSKHQKLAVLRNKLRRRLYVLFKDHLTTTNDSYIAVLYCSKQSTKLDIKEIKDLFYELFKKTTK